MRSLMVAHRTFRNLFALCSSVDDRFHDRNSREYDHIQVSIVYMCSFFGRPQLMFEICFGWVSVAMWYANRKHVCVD